MKNFLNFLKYNNTVPLVLGFLFLGTGAAFAASPEARDAAAAAVLSQQSQVVSVDNRYIVGKNLDTYTPRVRIDKVTEDPDSYHVSYTFTTIDIVDYIWKDVLKSEIMHVSKADLGQYGDLGLYVTAQLKQIIDRELAYLKDVQTKESKQVSQAIVATTYGGLVGKFLDSSTEALPGYVPVVTPPVVEHPVVPEPERQPDAKPVQPDATPTLSSASVPAPALVPLISLQILGSNPVRIAVGSTYTDLGVYLDDPHHTNAQVRISVDGAVVSSVSIDTSASGAHLIVYRAKDPAGASVKVQRVVLVGDATDSGDEIDFSGPRMSDPTSDSRDTPPVQVISPIEPVPTPAATSTPHVEPTPTPVVEPTPPAATSSTPQPDPTPQTPEPAPPATPAAAPEQSTSAPAL